MKLAILLSLKQRNLDLVDWDLVIQTQAQQDQIENHGIGLNGELTTYRHFLVDSWTHPMQKKIWDNKINATVVELDPIFTIEKSYKSFRLRGTYPDLLLAKKILESMNYFLNNEYEWTEASYGSF